MTSSTTPSSAIATPGPLSSLETSLNKIFLSVGDFADFNLETSSLYIPSLSPLTCSGLDAFSRKPQDISRRTLESNLQTFQSACDALEIQIVLLPPVEVVDENRAKQVLRREIELLANPPREEVEERVEEVPEPPEEEEHVEEEREEEVKLEAEEEQMGDEDELFSSEFDNLMDPNGFPSDIGFGDSMDWMNDV